MKNSIKKLSFLCFFISLFSQYAVCEQYVLGSYNQFKIAALPHEKALAEASRSACTFNALVMANTLLEKPQMDITQGMIDVVLFNGAQHRNPHGGTQLPTIEEASQQFNQLRRHKTTDLMLTDNQFDRQLHTLLTTDGNAARAFIVTIRNETFLIHRYARLRNQQRYVLFDSHGIAATSPGATNHPAVAIICDNVEELIKILSQNGFKFEKPNQEIVGLVYEQICDTMHEFQVSITPFDLRVAPPAPKTSVCCRATLLAVFCAAAAGAIPLVLRLM